MNLKVSTIGLAGVLMLSGGCAADGINEDEEENIGEHSQSEVVSFSSQNCPYESSVVGSVIPDKVLIIRNTGVVNDACRTQWTAPAGCSSDRVGRWTFWRLMENMRGTTPTAEFIIKFLEQFTDTSAVNTFAMQNRKKIESLIIDPWRQASNCAPGPWASSPCTTLRKELAPFRLLAIVNRMDLHANESNPSSYGGGDGGEGRLIFGFLDARGYLENGNYNGKMPKDLQPLQATVILEYGVVTDELGVDPTFWASNWMSLNSMNLSSEPAVFDNPFNNQLQFITDYLTGANLKPGNPNGSALNQIRTDEIDFDPSDPSDPINPQLREWELREHKLTCATGTSCSNALIKRVPVALTPANHFGYDMNLNTSQDLPPSTLSDFLQDATFGPQIDQENYDVPLTYHNQPFRGGSSRQGEFFAESQTWVNTAPPWNVTFFSGNNTVRTRRRLFGLGTCNGCHYNETKTQELHVGAREFGSASTLSPYLAVSPTSTSNYAATDPVTKISFTYNEPRRRICELLWVNDGNLTRLTTNAGRPH